MGVVIKMTTRFKGLMTWREDPSWYEWVDGQWILTDKAPDSARITFELYKEELRRYREELNAKPLMEE